MAFLTRTRPGNEKRDSATRTSGAFLYMRLPLGINLDYSAYGRPGIEPGRRAQWHGDTAM